MATVVLAEVVRSGFVESVHAGSAVLVHAGGMVERYGEPDRLVFPRSALKPLQAVRSTNGHGWRCRGQAADRRRWL